MIDRGLSYGDGLFETMRVVSGRCRYLELHHARMCHGLRRLDIALPDLSERMLAAVAAADDGVLKFIVTAGDGDGYGRADGAPGRVLTCWRPAPPATEDLRVSLCRTRLAWEPALTGMKHLGRLPQVLARREVAAAASDEGLMADPEGAWVCGTQSNLFLRVDGSWFTPRLDRGGVAGVMRRVLITALAPRLVRVDTAMLQAADRMLMSNAVRGLQWVSELDGRQLKVTPEGRKLSELLAPWRLDG